MPPVGTTAALKPLRRLGPVVAPHRGAVLKSPGLFPGFNQPRRGHGVHRPFFDLLDRFFMRVALLMCIAAASSKRRPQRPLRPHSHCWRAFISLAACQSGLRVTVAISSLL